ncbi:histidine kinase 3-like [Hibiscus syriacus]|uniref:Histidine kinase 3-like n=1 Tax=Hibiscus syriacus TaxID=106335 RepID=A0A6A3A228_HIBSY|nr:histidine kinase 3-like [Hibiscus syriacus]
MSFSGDLRSYMIELPPIGDSVVPELLLKALEPYRREGRARLYATIVNKGCAARFAFAAATFGEVSEALFWLQLPRAMNHFMNKLVKREFGKCCRLLLSTSPESPYFYPNALRAVALSSAVSRSLLELAVKVVAANMVRTDRSLSGIHLLCAVGRYQEACSQLQDAGCWTDAATLAAAHLRGSDYARVLQRWAEHVLSAEHNIWRALILFVAAGAMQEAAALRKAKQPDTASMFIMACREIHAEIITDVLGSDDESSSSSIKDTQLELSGLNPENEDVIAVCEYFGQYQRKLVHLCMDSQPFLE